MERNFGYSSGIEVHAVGGRYRCFNCFLMSLIILPVVSTCQLNALPAGVSIVHCRLFPELTSLLHTVLT